MRNVNLDSQRRRTQLRDVVNSRGPDSGRRIGHLKHRSLTASAAEALRMAEANALSVPFAGHLTGRDNDATVVYFLTDWSQSDGEDVTA